MKKREVRKETSRTLFSVNIRQAKNGLILEVKQGESPSEEVVSQERYGDEIECFADFLRLLNEELGPPTSRYSEKRIYVRVEPGDKFSGKTE